MKVSFIIVYCTPSMIFQKEYQSKEAWDHTPASIYHDNYILEHTKNLILQISEFPVEKEILVMDNSGDFPSDFKVKDLKVIPSVQTYLNTFGRIPDFVDGVSQDWFKKVKDDDYFDSKWVVSTAYQHGIEMSTGDYIILHHNDVEYLFEYYPPSKFINDVISKLENDNLEYITVDKKRIKEDKWYDPISGDDIPDNIEYYSDAYWFLCRSDFYDKHNIYVDWMRGDTNHLPTITCVNKNLKFLHLPGFYEYWTENDPRALKNFKEKLMGWYVELWTKVTDSFFNVHTFNDIPFLIHNKGGTELGNIPTGD